MEESEKSYYLAQAYGLRAFYYFDLYRTYGTAPLRLDPNEVVNGNFNPEDLYMERASGSKLMTQIKADLAESMRLFGDNNSFDPESRGNKKSYWSKAATEYLAAEVYLWNAKVSVDDNAANEADLAIAKQHCQSLMDNYGLSLMDNYADIFDVEHKGNSEIIRRSNVITVNILVFIRNFLFIVLPPLKFKTFIQLISTEINHS